MRTYLCRPAQFAEKYVTAITKGTSSKPEILRTKTPGKGVEKKLRLPQAMFQQLLTGSVQCVVVLFFRRGIIRDEQSIGQSANESGIG